MVLILAVMITLKDMANVDSYWKTTKRNKIWMGSISLGICCTLLQGTVPYEGGQQSWCRLLQYGKSFRTHHKLKFREIPANFSQFPSRFRNAHRVWQYYCRHLCKILKWLCNRYIFYGRSKFCDILVWDEFHRDITYYNDTFGVNSLS